MRVFKFGGASVKDAEAVRNMAQIVYQHGIQHELLVVVSAMGKTTNALEAIYEAYIKGDSYKELITNLYDFHQQITVSLFHDAEAPIYDLLPRLFDRLAATLERQSRTEAYDEGYDQIISFGEIISTHIVAHYLRTIDADAIWLDARQYIQTDSTWREGKIDWRWTQKIISTEVASLLHNHVVVTQGFIGGTLDGKTSTLGREGSDFTAAIFAHCLDAESLTIWKDVPGVLSADPKKFQQASLYTHLSYADAVEMTYYGATVIHPKTIRPLATKQIPLLVRSFILPEAEGTTIDTVRKQDLATSIIQKPNQRFIELSTKDYGFIAEQYLVTVLETLSRLNIKVNLLQVTAISLQLAVDDNERKMAKLKTSLPAELTYADSNGLTLLTLLFPTPTVEATLLAGKIPRLSQRTDRALQVLI
jgi:aspartate kinase